MTTEWCPSSSPPFMGRSGWGEGWGWKGSGVGIRWLGVLGLCVFEVRGIVEHGGGRVWINGSGGVQWMCRVWGFWGMVGGLWVRVR